MSDIGPTWLRRELPQPIASAWHQALEGIPVDGNAVVTAVEAALRFVAALQTASLISAGEALPEILTDPRRRRGKWSLGSWVHAVCELRDAAERPFLPELASWPDAETERRLWEFTRTRNERLAHAGQQTHYVRQEVMGQLAEQAAAVLETLSWLREVALVYFLEVHAELDGSFTGRAQVFRSWDDQPASERMAWRGPVEVHHLYLAPMRGDTTLLLDVEPLLRRVRLGDAPTEAICMWRRIGSRGEIELADDLQNESAWVPWPAALARVPFERVPVKRAPTDATFQEMRGFEPPGQRAAATAVDRPAPIPARGERRVRGKRTGLVAALALLVAAGGVAFALSSGDPAPLDLDGVWSFDTEVRVTKAHGRGVRGHYTITFEPEADDGTRAASILKAAYTEQGAQRSNPLSGRATFAPTAHRRSIAADTRLAGGGGATDVAFRVARRGDFLLGLWRYKGEAWEQMGLAGALVGVRQPGRGAAVAVPLAGCFHDCVEGCQGEVDPLAIEADDCLQRCAPRIDDCPR